MRSSLSSRALPLALSLTLGLGGCFATAQLPAVHHGVRQGLALHGLVTFGSPERSTQAEMSEVGNAATVSLLDATTGNTLGSSVTDASGNFVLTFDSLIPTNGSRYVLEAVKGLAVGGNPNRAGASAVRVRTLLFWDNGWKSLTNSTPGTGIVVSAATTAVSTIVGLKKNAGTTLTLSNLIGTINPSDNTFNEGGTGLTSGVDFTPVLGLVQSALQLDQDPVGAIAYDAAKGTYALATGIPVISSVSPSLPSPGGILTIKGASLDRLEGRNAFMFGAVQASTWSVSADRTVALVTVPSNASSAPFLLQQPNGAHQLLNPFLKIQGTVGTLAGSGAASYADGTGLVAQFNSPDGLAIGPDGHLYVADQNAHRIRKVTPAGVVTTVAGSGTLGNTDGTGTTAQFNQPRGLVFDSGGNLYVTEWAGNRIRKITPSGVVSTLAGSGTGGFNDAAGTSAQFNNPYGIGIDASDNLYVGDYMNSRIRKVTPAGVVSTYAGDGTAASVDGPALSARFNKVTGVALDGAGNVYAADYYNHSIRKITPGGTVSTLAGSASAGAFANAVGTNARFSSPHLITSDAAGNIYVGDQGNARIRKVAPDGTVTTLAGSGTGATLDGALTTAQFWSPKGVVLDGAGNLYVTDNAGHRLRVVTP